MYIFFVVLILIASILIILAVLAQSPKSGMAANFGASNQVMGARQTSDFLEKFTWTMAISIVVLSLMASVAMTSHSNKKQKADKIIEQTVGGEAAIPNQIKLDDVAPAAGEAAEQTEATLEPAQE